MKRPIATLVAVVALAGCASSHAPSKAHRKASHTLSAISKKSFLDGEVAGKSIAIRGETDGQMHANCRVYALENMPIGDIRSRYLEGCIVGTIVGMVP